MTSTGWPRSSTNMRRGPCMNGAFPARSTMFGTRSSTRARQPRGPGGRDRRWRRFSQGNRAATALSRAIASRASASSTRGVSSGPDRGAGSAPPPDVPCLPVTPVQQHRLPKGHDMSETEVVPGPTRPEEITARAVASFDGCDDARPARDRAGASCATCTRSRRDVGLTERGVGGRHPHPHRHRPHHRRQAPGVHPLVGLARPLDARRRAREPEPAGRDRVDGARAVLRAGLAAAGVRREHRGARGRARPGCTDAFSTSTAARSPAPRSTSGRTARTSCTRCRTRGARSSISAAASDARRRELRVPAVRPIPYTIPHDGPVGQMLEATRPSSMAARPHPHDRPRAGLPDGHDAHLRHRERLPRLGCRLRRQAVAPARVRLPFGRRSGAARRRRAASGARSRTTSCSRRRARGV